METESKDPRLWKIARQRAAFKYHAAVYSIVNVFLWALWFSHRITSSVMPEEIFPWPLWTTCGWGIGLLFNYLGVYKTTGHLAEKEYQKLIYNNNNLHKN